jgi:hypothetical protein
MAVKKIQMRPPDNNYADVLHPETDTTMVLLPDGSALQDQLVAPVASGSATELVIDMPGITSYTHCRSFQFIASANNNGAATTLKVGTLPARPIYLEGTANTAPNLMAWRLYTVWIDNGHNCFFLKASGSGNAVAADLLAGKTATTDNGPITGTMPDNGSLDATLTITGSAKPTIIIPAGYTSGGTITAQVDPSQAGNIKEGVTLGGVEGNLVPLNIENGSLQFTYPGVYGETVTHTISHSVRPKAIFFKAPHYQSGENRNKLAYQSMNSSVPTWFGGYSSAGNDFATSTSGANATAIYSVTVGNTTTTIVGQNQTNENPRSETIYYTIIY